MARSVVYVSIPALRAKDLAMMPNLRALAEGGEQVPLGATFPCVTCSVQSNLTTGTDASGHGVIANGFYWRDKHEVEMWTAWNEVVERPQVWDVLHERKPGTTSAAWFPMLIKGAGADVLCMPAPIHLSDGSESLWCYAKPKGLYGELLNELGHFPLQHFWGPMAKITSNQWIVDSAIMAAKKHRPDFFFLYLPHLDNVLQKYGPNSPESRQAMEDFDSLLGTLFEGFSGAIGDDVLWLAGSEYVITPVSGAAFPNRILREAGYLVVQEKDGAEFLDFKNSRAWAMVDHQLAHVFVPDLDDVPRVAELLRNEKGVGEVYSGAERKRVHLDHPRSGEVVLLAEPDRWFAYYWWLDDAKAPAFARTVDIHQKPGFDPVELFFDPIAKGIPLDTSLVQGSHGLPPDRVGAVGSEGGILICSQGGVLESEKPVADTDVMGLVLKAMRCDRG